MTAYVVGTNNEGVRVYYKMVDGVNDGYVLTLPEGATVYETMSEYYATAAEGTNDSKETETADYTVTNGIIVGPDGSVVGEYDYSKVSGLKRGTKDKLDELIAWSINNNGGKLPTREQYRAAGHYVSESAWDNLFASAAPVLDGIQTDLGGTDIVPQDEAFNKYYEDAYSLKEGTTGADIYDRLAEGYMNQGKQNTLLAEANYEQQAIRQAETVKAITDQVRAKRMARLRAGMSEAQIANQDMQMMMANMNALNENAAMMNQARLQGQTEQNLAKDNAYQAYLKEASTLGQTGAAMAATEAGDANAQARKYLLDVYGTTDVTKAQYDSALRNVQGLESK